jgi:hypothetical protein
MPELLPSRPLERRQIDRREAAAPAQAVWSIRAKRQMAGRTRDLAMFNLAIDSKLRGCDVVSLGSRTSLLTASRAIALRYARGRPVSPLG